MDKLGKFKMALEMYADLDAMHNGDTESEYMENVVRLLYEMVCADGDKAEKRDCTCGEAPKSAYVVFSYYGDKPAGFEYIFDNFIKAKSYVLNELTDYALDLHKDGEYFIAEAIERKIEELKELDESYFDSCDAEWSSKVNNHNYYLYFIKVEMNELIGIEF